MSRFKLFPLHPRLPSDGPPVRTLADMSEAEIVALEKQYGCPVKRPAKGKK